MGEFRRYPAGVQDFEVIRKEGFVYVDKTQYIYDLAHTQGNAIFLSRPRRFGKSLLCSTMKCYFQGRRDLFEGLAIDRLETEWTQYPVLHFDMSRAKNRDVEKVKDNLEYQLSVYEQEYGTNPVSSNLGDRLEWLVAQAHRQTGNKTVLIFDEYDSPMLEVIDDKGKMADVRCLLTEFYGPVKSMGEHLRFVFLTGITKFSQMSIFSTINNLTNISMFPQWEGICGITAQELVDNFSPEISAIAKREGFSDDQALARLRQQYDGYSFGPSLTEVYNPYSLLNAFASGILDDYWFAPGTPSSLIKVLANYRFNLSDIEGVELFSRDLNQSFDNFATAVPMLYQSGYLTIKGYDRLDNVYTLGIPNREVYRGLYHTLLEYYIDGDTTANTSLLLTVKRAMRRDDIAAAMTAVQSYLAALPYDGNSGRRNELDYERDLRIIFECIGIEVDTEVRNATGRCDVVIKTANKIYVIELKIDDTATVDDALAQIDEKNYLIPYWNDPRPVVKVGAVLDRATRTIREWKIA
ncbi:MAG: AAA family ATPase [Muribaculaceae bacterium]|nr:AAA family ATPase [Muribaculaceae bacterium]MBR1726081.1 AAA family ATPase [Muribaculaceae bacterium]